MRARSWVPLPQLFQLFLRREEIEGGGYRGWEYGGEIKEKD
jgi:hypothetical protein